MYDTRSIKSMINYALSLNVKHVIFIGDDEVNNKTITVKNLETGNQEEIKLSEIKRKL